MTSYAAPVIGVTDATEAGSGASVVCLLLPVVIAVGLVLLARGRRLR